MTIHHYHHESGEYPVSSQADEAQREPRIYVTPAFATNDAPPDGPEGKRAVFVAGEWTLQDIPTPEPEPETPPTVESSAISQGYTPFGLLNFSDIERELERQSIQLSEKSGAVRHWVNDVRTALLAGTTTHNH